MAKVTVTAGRDLLESYTRTPRVGLCELVWNAFDEDAQRVDIEIETNAIEGLDAVLVRDCGNGLTYERAEMSFSRLGDSWKRMPGTRTAQGRPVHGRYGRGRYAAFSIGELVSWESTAPATDGGFEAVTVRGSLNDLQTFDVVHGKAITNETGTVVRILNPTKEATATFDDVTQLANDLVSEFALHLERFPAFEIYLLGTKVDPAKVILSKTVIPLQLDAELGGAELTIIDWDLENIERRLYLCTSDGSIIEDRPPGIQAPGAEFTAYLKWSGFDDGIGGPLFEDDESTPAARVLIAAKDALRTHILEAGRAKEAETIGRWKAEGLYPYKEEPKTRVDRAARDAFNLVAMAASRTVDDGRSQKLKRMSLALLKETFERDPESLLPILQQVTNLSKARIEELDELLKHTTLAQLVQLGRKVGDRVSFLQGLGEIIHGRGKKPLKERRQLHRILAHETWVFGEEWSLMGDDERLTKVLEKHLKRLDPDVELGSIKPVLRVDGSDAIPDLVFGQRIETSQEEWRHLVVELKRPTRILTDDDVSQLRSYANAVANDERFDQPNAQWDFVLVGNSANSMVNEQREQVDKPHGQVQTSKKYRIWVRTWAEILSTAEHRLKFVQASLNYSSSVDDGILYLREKYAAYLPPDVSGADGGLEGVSEHGEPGTPDSGAAGSSSALRAPVAAGEARN